MRASIFLTPTGYPLLKVSGDLTFESRYSALHGQIDFLIASGLERIILDLGNVTEIDSAGIGELIRAYQTVSKNGRRLILLNMPQRVAFLFHRGGLNFISDDRFKREPRGFPEPESESGRQSTSEGKLEKRKRRSNSPSETRRPRTPFFTPLALLALWGASGLGDSGPALLPSRQVMSAYAFTQPARKALPGTIREGWSQGKKNKPKGHRKAIELRIVVRDFYSSHDLPPGLAKRDRLPPGLERQLAEKGRLPPGLEKRLYPVPSALAIRFGPIAVGQVWYFLGDDLILLQTDHNRVVRIVADVWL